MDCAQRRTQQIENEREMAMRAAKPTDARKAGLIFELAIDGKFSRKPVPLLVNRLEFYGHAFARAAVCGAEHGAKISGTKLVSRSGDVWAEAHCGGW